MSEHGRLSCHVMNRIGFKGLGVSTARYSGSDEDHVKRCLDSANRITEPEILLYVRGTQIKILLRKVKQH